MLLIASSPAITGFLPFRSVLKVLAPSKSFSFAPSDDRSHPSDSFLESLANSQMCLPPSRFFVSSGKEFLPGRRQTLWPVPLSSARFLDRCFFFFGVFFFWGFFCWGGAGGFRPEFFHTEVAHLIVRRKVCLRLYLGPLILATHQLSFPFSIFLSTDFLTLGAGIDLLPLVPHLR